MGRKRRRGSHRRRLDIQATFRRAGEAFNAGQLSRAESLLQEVLREQPGSLECWNNLGFIKHLQGRTDEALRCYRRVLATDPRHASARFNLAKGLLAQQRAEEAEAQLRELLAIAPANVEALNELGSVHHAAGRVQEAARCYREALAHAPNYTHALRNLGELLRIEGEFEQAADILRRYLDLQSSDGAAWLSLGEVLLVLAQNEAVTALQRAAELADDEATFWRRLGGAWLRVGNWRGALHAYQNAQRNAPQDVSVLIGLARAYLDAGELQQAEKILIDAPTEDYPPSHRSELLNMLGVVRLSAQDVQGAERAFERSLRTERTAIAQSNLGLALGAQGLRKQAQAAYRAAIELDADLGEAYHHLSHSTKCQSLQDELPRTIAGALRRETSESSRMYLHFAMGKQCDDCAAYDQAFDHYARGNAIHFRRHPFDPAAWQRHVARIRAVFDSEYFSTVRTAGNASQPVFVVGMPRSGTTLIEQIIARNSHGAGRSELRKIEQLVFRLESGGDAYPECVPALPVGQLAAMAADYLTELQRGEVGNARCIVDKMPFNFLHLGLITTLLPDARVVHVRRDPLDTCLSNFFQLFPGGAEYAYDLRTLGRYYRTYTDLMQHWCEVLPRTPLTVQYEHLVREPEAQTRRLLDYLRLPWESECLAFHEQPRDVLTLSTWQVREPLYATSVARWRHYEGYLEPLRAALADDGPA